MDLGCGNGALTELIAKNRPQSFVIGLDNSTFFLRMLKNERKMVNMEAVKADVTQIPVKSKSVDSVVASSVLHEILHFKSRRALHSVFRRVCAVVKPCGQFIIFDHVNPGKDAVEVRLTSNLSKKLEVFGERFRPRKIQYEKLKNGWMSMSLRDFYDFITKASFLDSSVEMNETHTPFTTKQLKTWLQNSGFKIVFEHGMEDVESYIKYYRVKTMKMEFPKRKLLLEARREHS